MADNVITVENLSKLYRLDHQSKRPDSFRDLLTNTVTGPLRRLRAMRGEATRSTEDFWALKDVSFTVRRGEVLGVIGRNGAGKSTLLKILSRIVEPTSGRVVMRGRVASLLEVGTGFHPELTGRENIYMNGSILGMKKREIAKRFDEIVDFAEIEKFLDTPVKRYSSGMYVRLAFAVAAHLDPEILIVDEVLAVGDAAFQKKCIGKLNAVATSGARTVLFVSHQLNTLSSLCTSGVYLLSGSVHSVGDINSIIASYRSNASRDEGLLRVKDGTISLDSASLSAENSSSSSSSNSSTHFKPGDNVTLSVNLRTNTITSSRAQIDIALHNGKDECILHCRSSQCVAAIELLPDRLYKAQFSLGQLHISPGEYYLTVYVVDEFKERLWIEQIPLANYVNRAQFGILDSFQGLKAAIAQPFGFHIHEDSAAISK